MTSRERMMVAYRGGTPDAVPVSPELWDAAALDLLGLPFAEVVGPFARRPFWELLLEVHRHFATDAWVVVGAEGRPACTREEEHRFLDEETIETRTVWRACGGEVSAVSRTTPSYAGWKVEHPVKDLDRDLSVWESCVFFDPADADCTEIERALEATGDSGLVTVAIGELFTSFLGSSLQGGMTAALLELADRGESLRPLAARYAAHLAGLAATVLERTAAEAVFLNSGYTQVPVVGPALYRQWDLPVIRAVCEEAHRRGGCVHLHNHGCLLPILPDLVAAGVDLVCGLFSPPTGDVTSLAGLTADSRMLCAAAGRAPIGLKGMIDPFGALRHGTPDEVEHEVQSQIRSAREGGGGGAFILGTQDGTLAGTPAENLRALVRAGRAHGSLG